MEFEDPLLAGRLGQNARHSIKNGNRPTCNLRTSRAPGVLEGQNAGLSGKIKVHNPKRDPNRPTNNQFVRRVCIQFTRRMRRYHHAPCTHAVPPRLQLEMQGNENRELSQRVLDSKCHVRDPIYSKLRGPIVTARAALHSWRPWPKAWKI